MNSIPRKLKGAYNKGKMVSKDKQSYYKSKLNFLLFLIVAFFTLVIFLPILLFSPLCTGA